MQDYIFSLLTGYTDPPAGFEIREGMNYNAYFPGNAISMARVLFDGLVEFDDGTPATTSQMAKDVVTFLNWAAEPEHDERKKAGIKAVILFSALTAISLYVKRYKWSYIKSRKIRESGLAFMHSSTLLIRWRRQCTTLLPPSTSRAHVMILDSSFDTILYIFMAPCWGLLMQSVVFDDGQNTPYLRSARRIIMVPCQRSPTTRQNIKYDVTIDEVLEKK